MIIRGSNTLILITVKMTCLDQWKTDTIIRYVALYVYSIVWCVTWLFSQWTGGGGGGGGGVGGVGVGVGGGQGQMMPNHPRMDFPPRRSMNGHWRGRKAPRYLLNYINILHV